MKIIPTKPKGFDSKKKANMHCWNQLRSQNFVSKKKKKEKESQSSAHMSRVNEVTIDQLNQKVISRN